MFHQVNKLILFLLVFSSCSRSHHNAGSTFSKNNVQTSFQLPSSFFLENRVENCDSAIVYMGNVVLPMGIKDWDTITSKLVSVYVKYRIPGEKMFLQKNHSIPSFNTGSYRFYISSSCFVGHPLEDVLDVFCTPRDKKMLLMNDKLVRDFGRKTWFIVFFDGLGNLDGVIIDSTSMVSDVLRFAIDIE